jgi:hypothetical protein
MLQQVERPRPTHVQHYANLSKNWQNIFIVQYDMIIVHFKYIKNLAHFTIQLIRLKNIFSFSCSSVWLSLLDLVP